MKSARKMLAILLCIMLIGSVAACGSNKAEEKPWLQSSRKSSSVSSITSTIASDPVKNNPEGESGTQSSYTEPSIAYSGDEEGRINVNDLDPETMQEFLQLIGKYVEFASREEMENWGEMAFEDIPLLNAFPLLDFYSIHYFNNVPEGFTPEIEEVKLWSAASPEMQKAVQYQWDLRRVGWKNHDMIPDSFYQENPELCEKLYQVDPFENYEYLAEIKTNVDDYWAVLVKDQGNWTLVSFVDRPSVLLKGWYQDVYSNVFHEGRTEYSEESEEILRSLANHVTQWLGEN